MVSYTIYCANSGPKTTLQNFHPLLTDRFTVEKPVSYEENQRLQEIAIQRLAAIQANKK